MKEAVIVSHEMTTLVGIGAAPLEAPTPSGSIMFLFGGFADGTTPTLTCRDRLDLGGLEDAPLVLVVTQEACSRVFGVDEHAAQSWHLPSELRALALSLIECEGSGELRTALRLARSIELLCQIHAALEDGTLVPLEGECALAETDVARIAAARRLIDQQWQGKLTIPDIARNVGVNRDKLVRGFRQLYGATIAEVLTERRLSEARRMLLASDLPVSSVAYRCSYLNNASFTRAFTRHFGVAPSALRRTGIAA